MKPITFVAVCGMLIAAVCLNPILARPYKDSPIQRIIVPYQRKTISGHPYQYPNAVHETRQVLVPKKMEIIPSFNLHSNNNNNGMIITMNASGVGGGVGGDSPASNGMPVNFVDGAYPVYYMPGNVNGKFNGKISLLTK